MLYCIRVILFSLVLLFSIQTTKSQENAIITIDDLKFGLVDLDCGDASFSYKRFLDKYDVLDDRRYILVMPSGRSLVLYEKDKKYQFLLSKKAHQNADSYFSVLTSQTNDKEVFVVYYPDFLT